MSKISDRLSSLGQSAPVRLGFGQLREKKRSPVILTVGSNNSGARNGAATDLVIVRARKGGKPSTAAPESAEIWGAALSDCTLDDLDALKEAGCDFILIEEDSAPATVLRDDGMGRGLVLPADLTERRARALEDLPLDFVLVRSARPSWPLSLAALLPIQDIVSSLSKHLFLEIDDLPGKEDLPILRDMPISGLVFDPGAFDADRIEELKAEIARLDPRKSRQEHVAVLPSNMVSSASAPQHAPEPDEDDEDDD